MFTRLLALLLLPHLSSSSTPVPGATDLAAAINAAASLTSSSFVLDPDTLYQGVTVDILRNHDSFACEILCSDLFQQCKISGGGTTRVFYVYGENKEQSGVFTHLSGLVVMDGYGDYGAGMYMKSSVVLVTLCTFIHNHAYDDGGGAIYITGEQDSWLDLYGVTFVDNTVIEDGSYRGRDIYRHLGTVTIHDTCKDPTARDGAIATTLLDDFAPNAYEGESMSPRDYRGAIGGPKSSFDCYKECTSGHGWDFVTGRCEPCPAGGYGDGLTPCQLCAADTYSDATRAETDATCAACPADLFSNEGSNGLDDCVSLPTSQPTVSPTTAPTPAATSTPTMAPTTTFGHDCPPEHPDLNSYHVCTTCDVTASVIFVIGSGISVIIAGCYVKYVASNPLKLVKLKILASFWQASQLTTIIRLPWPALARYTIPFSMPLNDLKCASTGLINYHQTISLLITIWVPIIFLLKLVFMAFSEDLGSVKSQRLGQVTTFILILWYPAVVQTAAAMFRCYKNVETQEMRLVADERVSCDYDGGAWMYIIRSHCYLVLILVMFGIPIFIFRRTHSRLQKTKNARESFASQLYCRCSSAFSDPYKDQFYYFQGVQMVRKALLIGATNAPMFVSADVQSFTSLGINLAFLAIVVCFKPYAFVRSGFFKDDRKYGLFNIMEIWCLLCVCGGNICAIIGVYEKGGNGWDDLEIGGSVFAGLNVVTFCCLQFGFSWDRWLARKALKAQKSRRESRKDKKPMKKEIVRNANSGGVELAEINETSAETRATSNPVRREASKSTGEYSTMSELTMDTLAAEQQAQQLERASTGVSSCERTSWLTTFDDANNTLTELSAPEVASEFMEIGLDMYVEAVLNEQLDGEHLMNLAIMRDENILDDALIDILGMLSDEHRDLCKDWIKDHLANVGGVNERSVKGESTRVGWETEAVVEEHAVSASERFKKDMAKARGR